MSETILLSIDGRPAIPYKVVDFSDYLSSDGSEMVVEEEEMHQQLEDVPPPTFTCFPKLPPELRLKIWNDTFPGPSLVAYQPSVEAAMSLLIENPPWLWHGAPWHHVVEKQFHKLRTSPPVALRVNHESRAEALKHLSLLYSNDGFQYLFHNTDTLSLPHMWLMSFKGTRDNPSSRVLSWPDKRHISSSRVLPPRDIALKIRSLMIWAANIDDWEASGDLPLPGRDNSFEINYQEIMAVFPNLRELFVRTNMYIGAGGTVAEVQSFWEHGDNKQHRTPLLAFSGYDPAQPLIEDEDFTQGFLEVDDGYAGLEDIRLLDWIDNVGKYFRMTKKEHPELNLDRVKLRLVGKDVACFFDWHEI